MTDLDGRRLETLKQARILPDDFTTPITELRAATDAAEVTYADPENMKFPCHTKEATLASMAYFYSELPETHGDNYQKIAEALKFWGTMHEIDPETASQVKEAAETSLVQAPVDDTIPGTDLPLRDRDDALGIVSHLQKYAAQYMPVTQRRIATAVLESRFQLPIAETNFLQKIAGIGFARWSKVAQTFENYGLACQKRGKVKESQNLFAFAKTANAQNPAEFVGDTLIQKFAGVADTYMRSAFGRGVTAADFVEATPATIHAYKHLHVKLANNHVVSVDDCAAIPAVVLAPLFGATKAGAIIARTPQGRQALEQAPAETANELCQLVKSTPPKQAAWMLDIQSLLNGSKEAAESPSQSVGSPHTLMPLASS